MKDFLLFIFGVFYLVVDTMLQIVLILAAVACFIGSLWAIAVLFHSKDPLYLLYTLAFILVSSFLNGILAKMFMGDKERDE